AFLAVEIAVAALPDFPLPRVPVLRGMPYASAQDRSILPDRSAGQNKRALSSDVHAAGSSEHDIGRPSIRGRSTEMPSDHQAAPAAFETNDIIAVNRPPNRHGGGPLSLGSGAGFRSPESA
ncbi:MAG TPA: hypothetical protein VKB81_02000, partial [Nitrospira sp.]|nr:hypothetical protein [Nitrospira sp.]